MPNKYRNRKLWERTSSSYKYVEKLVSKFVAPYIVPGLVIYGLINFFSIPLNKKFFLMVGSAFLWVAYILVVIFLAIQIKNQADMQKTQQKLKMLGGRKIATEIEAFAQEVLPIIFEVVVKLGFAIGLLYLHLLNEKRKWAVYTDRFTFILLIVLGILLLLIYFSIAFYVSKIDVEVVKNAKEKLAEKKAPESIEKENRKEKTTAEHVVRPMCGYHPYFDPKLEGSINYGLAPIDANWVDYATSPYNLHPSNPNRDPNAIMPQPMVHFMNNYAKGEVKGLSEEIVKPREQSQTESENKAKDQISSMSEEVNEKKIGEQPDRFSASLRVNTDHLQAVLANRKQS